LHSRIIRQGQEVKYSAVTNLRRGASKKIIVYVIATITIEMQRNLIF